MTPRLLPAAAALALACAVAGCATTAQNPSLLVDSGTTVQGQPPRTLWLWQDYDTGRGPTRVVGTPQRYTIRFLDNGHVELHADCNRGGGRYRIGNDGTIMIGAFEVSNLACAPGSLERPFLEGLRSANRYRVTEDELVLVLPDGWGTMRFAALRR